MTLTEQQEKIGRQIFDLLGNSQITKLVYEMDDSDNSKIMWLDTDGFAFEIKCGWADKRGKLS